MTTTHPDPWAVAADVVDPPRNPLVDDPVAWVHHKTKEHVWSKQRQILESVRDHRLTAVPSCHGPGKSFVAARALAAWIDSHPALEAFGVTSAPTDPQVKAVLWREITRTHRKGALGGRVTLDAQWKMYDELVAFGRKPADIAAGSAEETVTAFQGIHARFVLVIFDEASGIPRPLWTAAQSLLTNADARFLAIGNPDDPSSEFARICRGAPAEGGMSTLGWNVIPISLFDTPNFTGEDVPDELRPYLPSQQWLDDFVLNVGGPGTAIYTSKVEGRFPEDKADGVVPWSWIHGCRTDETRERHAVNRANLVELGVDVGASDNGDLTVVRERRGMVAGRRWTVQSADPEIVARTVVEAARECDAGRIKVDAIGVGWGLVSLVARDLPGVAVVPVTVSEAAPDGPNGERYANLRAALWWELGRLLSQSKAWDLTALDDRALADLAEPKWWEDKAGRIVVEPKDKVRERLGRSPDDADALLLAFYVPPVVVDELVVHEDDDYGISPY